MLFGKLLPREGDFFALFDQHGERIVEGVRAFMLMIENYPDVALREKYANEVGHAERQADRRRPPLQKANSKSARSRTPRSESSHVSSMACRGSCVSAGFFSGRTPRLV